MSIVYENIISILKKLSISYKEWDHEAVFTSEDAARIRGRQDASEGAKALLFKTKESEFVLVVIPADEKADTKKIKQLHGTKDLRLASPEEVLEVTGVKIGCVTPFGLKNDVRTYVKKTVFDIDTVFLNPGLHTKTLCIKGVDLKKVMQKEHVIEFD